MANGKIEIKVLFEDEDVARGLKALGQDMGDFESNIEKKMESAGKKMSEDIKEGAEESISSLEKFQGKLDGMSGSMKDVGTKMSIGVTAPIVAVGTMALNSAAQFEESAIRMQTALGATEEEAEKLTKTSRNIFKDGFGEGVEEVDAALIQVKQNIKDINDEELEIVTKSSMALADTFDADVNEVTRAGQNLMKGFGTDAVEAFDLMAYGAQNGLDFSNELFDNLSEYAPLFGKMGFSAEEYFELLSKGSEAGVYNLDYINDVMKEFQIRVKDNSKGTSEAMAAMSEETQGVWESFLSGEGTVKDVSNAVLGELKNMDDQVAANEIGVQLYGVKWEDLEADAMYAMSGIGGGLEDVDGSMNKLNETMEAAPMQRLSALWRTMTGALTPLGNVLLDIAENIMPYVEAAVEGIATALENMSPGMQTTVIIVAGLAAALGPIIGIAGMVAGGISKIAMALPIVTGLITKVTGAFKLFGLVMMANPIGAVIAAIAALAGIFIYLYNTNDKVKESIDKLWASMKEFFSGLWESIKTGWAAFQEWLSGVGASIGKGITALGEKISSGWSKIGEFFTNLIDKAKNIGSTIKENVLGIGQSILDGFNNIVEKVGGFLQGILDKIFGIKDKLFEAGGNIVGSIADGITGGVSKAVEAIDGVVSKIRDYLPFSPAKEGPLKDIMYPGITNSLAENIRKGKNRPLDEMAKLTEGIKGELPDNLSMSQNLDRNINTAVNAEAALTNTKAQTDLRGAITAQTNMINALAKQSGAGVEALLQQLAYLKVISEKEMRAYLNGKDITDDTNSRNHKNRRTNKYNG